MHPGRWITSRAHQPYLVSIICHSELLLTCGRLEVGTAKNSILAQNEQRLEVKTKQTIDFSKRKAFSRDFINNSTRLVSSWIFHKLFTAVNFSIYVFWPRVLCHCVMLSRYQQTSQVADKKSSVNVFWWFLLSAISDRKTRDWINLRRNFNRNWTADSWCWWRSAEMPSFVSEIYWTFFISSLSWMKRLVA